MQEAPSKIFYVPSLYEEHRIIKICIIFTNYFTKKTMQEYLLLTKTIEI